MATQSGGRTTKQRSAGKRAPAKTRGSTDRSDAVGRVMQTDVHRVAGAASANDAARLMWDEDIGSVPVVDEDDRLIGIVTDRDIAMAAYLRGANLWSIPVASLMAREVVSAHADDSVHDVASLMSRRQVRRVPVVDRGGVLVGIVSLNDLALEATEAEDEGGLSEREISDLLRAICAPRPPAAPERHAN
jgi:CBS domain-containing protein